MMVANVASQRPVGRRDPFQKTTTSLQAWAFCTFVVLNSSKTTKPSHTGCGSETVLISTAGSPGPPPGAGSSDIVNVKPFCPGAGLPDIAAWARPARPKKTPTVTTNKIDLVRNIVD